MKAEIARIHSHTDAICRSTAELIAELAALPPCEPIEASIHDVAAELAKLTGDCVSIDMEHWHHIHDVTKSDRYRIWLSFGGYSVEGDTLEAARAKAASAWEARQVTA